MQALLILLGLLAALSVLASEMPRAAAWPLAVAAIAHGARLARREGRRPRVAFWFPGDGRPPRVDGVPVHGTRVQWRGPLAFVRWQSRPGGRWQRLAWWPDTLPAQARRELRLAAPGGDASRTGAGMAT